MPDRFKDSIAKVLGPAPRISRPLAAALLADRAERASSPMTTQPPGGPRGEALEERMLQGIAAAVETPFALASRYAGRRAARLRYVVEPAGQLHAGVHGRLVHDVGRKLGT